MLQIDLKLFACLTSLHFRIKVVLETNMFASTPTRFTLLISKIPKLLLSQLPNIGRFINKAYPIAKLG